MAKPIQLPNKLLIAFDDERLEAIDEWRRQEPDLPTRSEAIRRLLDQALVAAADRPTKRRGR
jgi:metal-responsive CopG/Arc/MetJ family transcriptional regulator